MQMMKCPSCGAANSIKRGKCFSCEADLHAAPTARVSDGPLHVCKNCIHSTVFPPAGKTLGYSEVWCLRFEFAKEAEHPADKCFEPSFTWRREESLD